MKKDRQTEAGGGKREETVKGEKRERDFFFAFFFFLGWADLTCLYRPRVKITLILSYTLTPSSAMNISFKCTAMGRRTGHYEMTFQFRFEVTYLGM